VFANGGYRVDSYFIDRIEDALGRTVYQATPKVVCEHCDAGAPPTPALALTPTATVAAGTGGNPGLGITNPPAATSMTPGAMPISAAAPLPPATAPPAAPPDANHAPLALDPPLLPGDRIAPRVLSAQNAWLMDDMMADVIRRGTGIRAWLALRRSDISGKTGTTNEARDTWFNGFNRNIITSVWVGFDDERPLGEGEEGSRTAVPIWTSFMREALRGQPDRPRPMPAGLVTERISKRTGLLAGYNDADAMYETFMDGSLPPAASSGITPSAAVPQSGGSSAEPLF